MNIAIIAPSPYRFLMGGAEHFYLGLQQFINESTHHVCELVKIPTREGSLPELVESYRQHARADLLGYDRIVSCKYPAWMACHPNHAVYMLHPLRGLYDAYRFPGASPDPEWPDSLAWLRQEIELLQYAPCGDNGPAISLLDTLESAIAAGHLAEPFMRFPGPFARCLVRALDSFALQAPRIASYTALSRTVAGREGYFPAGTDCAVVYPPPRLTGFRCGADDYLFTVSRLDRAKRIDLLIEAMRHVKADIPLLIGGTGPDEARLKDLAADNPRIRFLGPLTDGQLLDAYADALAVPFVPYDEDYGLVTIEAMRSAKPVLSVTDSGGVNEFVHHGETGLCVAPQAHAIAAAIDQLCADRAATRRMGLAARRRVQGISWKPLAERLLGMALPAPAVMGRNTSNARPRRKKAVVALTFAVSPPRGGGESRVFHLYKILAQEFDVTLVCLCDVADAERLTELAPGYREIRIPKSADQHQNEYQTSLTVNATAVTDIVAARDIHLTPRFVEVLDQACADADVVIACHPYFAPLLMERYPHLPLWLEAQDVELPLKRGILPACQAAQDLLAIVERAERSAWHHAEVVFSCVESDLSQLENLYGPTKADTFEVPNGFAEEEVGFVPTAERHRLKAMLGLAGRPLVIFIGSWHGPNLEAIERIVGYAQALPEVTFAIIGSGGLFLQGRQTPQNLRLLGRVDHDAKRVFLSAADLAINPMSSGSGSNLKMLDYFAAGAPVLSTGFGARGIDFQPGVHFVATELNDFLPCLVRCLIEPGLTHGMPERANDRARLSYSWRSIGQRALARLTRHLAS